MTDQWAKVPVALLDWWASSRLTGQESAVLAYMLKQTLGQSRETTAGWAGRAAICAATGLDKQGAQRAVDRLKARGILVVEREASAMTPTEYRIALSGRGGVTGDTRGHGRPQGSLAIPGVTGDTGGGVMDDPRGGVTGDTPYQSRDQITDQSSPPTPRARGGFAESGPPPVRVPVVAAPSGDTADVVREVWRAVERPGPSGWVRPPSVLAEQTLAMAVEEVGAERVWQIARSVAARGWGSGGLLRCFDDDGQVVEARLPRDSEPVARGMAVGSGQQQRPVQAKTRWQMEQDLERRLDYAWAEHRKADTANDTAEADRWMAIFDAIAAERDELRARIALGEIA